MNYWLGIIILWGNIALWFIFIQLGNIVEVLTQLVKLLSQKT